MHKNNSTVQNLDSISNHHKNLIQAPNFTQVPNVVIDHWQSFFKSGPAFAVLVQICRKTFGWHKSRDRISLQQLEKGTGFSRKTVIKAIDELIKQNLIIKFKSKTELGDDAPNEYEINVIESIVLPLMNSQNQEEGSVPDTLPYVFDKRGGSVSGTLPVVYQIHTQKKDYAKENPPPPLSHGSSEKNSIPRSAPLKRREEEEILDFLEEVEGLSRAEKLRLTKSYSREEIISALEIARTHEVKKTLMHLLIDILKHPERWEVNRGAESTIQQLANKYNSMIETVDKPMFKENQSNIKKGLLWFKSSIGDQQISLNSDYADQEIKQAIQWLKEKKHG